jgi:hypothetical protein
MPKYVPAAVLVAIFAGLAVLLIGKIRENAAATEPAAEE